MMVGWVSDLATGVVGGLAGVGGLWDRAGVLLAQLEPVEEFIFRRNAQSKYADGVDDIFMFITWASVAVFIALMAIMVFWTVKYRRKPGVAAPRSTSHNTVLEITWTAIPTVIFVAFFFFGFRAYAKLVVGEGDSQTQYLSAKKWGWDIQYPNGSGATETKKLGAREVPVFFFPEDTSVVLQMTSADVIHSFWVPDYRHKQDVFPNRYTSFVFHTEKIGPNDLDDPTLDYPHREHWVFCAEYCGDLHAEMAAIIRVVTKERFQQWLDSPYAEGMSMAEIGEIVATSKGCFACHAKTEAAGAGPGWGNWFGAPHSYTDGSTIVADANHTRESILNPQAKIRVGYPANMPAFAGAINDFELNALIEYMKSLSTHASPSNGGAEGEGDAGGTGEAPMSEG